MRLIINLMLVCMISATANAEVVKSSADGFIVRQKVTIRRDQTHVFKTMTHKVGTWWNPDHSFSGDAGNMRIDRDCFCERWGDNLVRHLNTTIWRENDKVVLQGGLGPLKELGLSGTMIWSLTSTDDGGTSLSWNYHVYGYSETDLPGLATAVDGVLKEQLERLVDVLK